MTPITRHISVRMENRPNHRIDNLQLKCLFKK
jgi:hypothetical protein